MTKIDIHKLEVGEQKDILTEAKTIESCEHPNIINFKEVFETPKGKLCIVMEYTDGGNL